ncbi:FAD-dependent oxidoreductase [Streptomyces sp. NPDC005761]|uniref:FAD-dependent oxidoreductase n=1 Tax=Streptomyces sp. NPDC005761 TaxID=3157066 RepID=UPI0033EA1922
MTGHWDHQVDLLVVGSGAGGLGPAVVGAREGLDVLVLERTERLGGTTAYSAGTAWVPRHHQQEDPAVNSTEARRRSHDTARRRTAGRATTRARSSIHRPARALTHIAHLPEKSAP